jgi:hypothetical protein
MTRFVAVSREIHGSKAWRRPGDYTFAATESLLSLIGNEVAKAALAMPLAFVEQSGGYIPVAVASLQPGRNLFVGPEGQWLGRYLPLGLRSYPFRLAQGKSVEDVVLCIDEDSGLISDRGEVNSSGTNELFFDRDGSTSTAIKDITKHLIEIEVSRRATEIAMRALKDAGVICAWDLKMKTDQGEKPVHGLCRIDEPALNALSAEAFLALRKVSALTIAYAQLFSTDQMSILPMMARTQARLTPPPPPAQTALERLMAANPDGLIQF